MLAMRRNPHCLPRSAHVPLRLRQRPVCALADGRRARARTAASSSATRSTRSARCKGGRLVDETRHMDRLERSLDELGSPCRWRAAAWARVLRETIRRNRVVQRLALSAGVARRAGPRDFFFPPAGTPPTVVVRRAARASRAKAEATAAEGHRHQDDAGQPLGALRYQDGDAAAGLPRQGGGAGGGGERRLVRRREGLRHRGGLRQCLDRRQRRAASSPARSTTTSCAGVTRTTLLDLLRREGIEVVERPFTVDGGQGRARGLHHIGDQPRDAGRAHRRADRSATGRRACCA